ncbi:hypothetical protein [Salibacterium lacus]|uniref:Uncharacterized protein n=1 Tax=Salibacterium lacus TaxID=1898109 RepID=A0ABW5T472_9BACI
MESIRTVIIVLGSFIIMTGLVRKLADIIGNQLDFYGLLQQAWYKVKKK